MEVEIPDVQGCMTFGADFEEAYDMAVDALAAVLANSEAQFIKRKPSTYEEISKKLKAKGQAIFPVPVDETIMHAYAPKKRINVVSLDAIGNTCAINGAFLFRSLRVSFRNTRRTLQPYSAPDCQMSHIVSPVPAIRWIVSSSRSTTPCSGGIFSCR
ncbi:MAG: hypothetical protein GY866_35250 [Proteobacteria bacterium]|nr:hypothetical protein [Pseudomonadota bacterium]